MRPPQKTGENVPPLEPPSPLLPRFNEAPAENGGKPELGAYIQRAVAELQ